MDNSMPILLVPGLVSSPRIFSPVVPALWRYGPVTIANHIRDDNMGAIARRILAEAPPRFALAGHSMGGYIAFEILRQAPERVAKLALINTQARPDTSEATTRRHGMISRARSGEYRAVLDELFPGLVHPLRLQDAALRQLVYDMGDDVGPEAFIRQQIAVIGRPELAAIAGVDQMSDAGAERRPGQHYPEFALDGDGQRHPRSETQDTGELRAHAAGGTAAGDRGCAGRMAAELKRFQAKWVPVRVKKTRRKKSCSGGTNSLDQCAEISKGDNDAARRHQ